MTEELKAYELARKQREISVAEFFEKNRHLLGFDNKRKALLTAVKEAVDNSLDACEEAKILPEVIVELVQMGEERFRVIVEDNGPGIVKAQIPKVFGKLLYGSKFHHLQQKRGQQGIGISAAVLYAQLTTGKPARVTSKIGPGEPAQYMEISIDIQGNKPDTANEKVVEWKKERGTKIEMEVEASYQKGLQSVDEYIKETAIINPHVTIIYTNPKAEQSIYSRSTDQLPAEPKEIKPHPYGVEIGILMRLLDSTQSRSLQSFLTSEFSRVGDGTAKEICQNAGLLPNMKPGEITRQQAEKLMEGIEKTKIISPPTDCLSPIGESLIERGMKSVINAEFYCSTSRPTSVYRGNPFVIECGVAFGGEIPADGAVTILRFANRVPLLYQQGACAMTESITKTGWKAYGLSQSQNAIPVGPAVILVHMASVWVPFTSEAKEALAHYPEIIKEIKLALQECGRKLGMYINRKTRVTRQLERANLFERYIPELADSLAGITDADREDLAKKLAAMLHKPEIKAQLAHEENKEYDEKKKLKLKRDEDAEE
ncbi:DNA topoisomerase VI subunit B [Candidatus Woesearchaeota archaeon]|nr:DNA topoisomerase VI subunit B [Candidatus Woesearchaeota archaeon]